MIRATVLDDTLLRDDPRVLILYDTTPVLLLDYVRQLLTQAATIYFEDSLNVSFRLLARLKSINYINTVEEQGWQGSFADGFAGIRRHASDSFSSKPITVFFLSNISTNTLQEIKKCVREFSGKHSIVHTSDTRYETIQIARLLLSSNTRFLMSIVPLKSFMHPTHSRLYRRISKSVNAVSNFPCDSLTFTGSTLLDFLHIRQPRDLDFISTLTNVETYSLEGLDDHSSELRFYQSKPDEIVYLPSNHFYLDRYKIISPRLFFRLKRSRREVPKDIVDLLMLVFFILFYTTSSFFLDFSLLSIKKV